jgi:hypothetical protein
MKKTLILICLLLPIIAKSQLTAEMGVGASTKKTAALQLGFNYQYKDYFAHVGYVSHLSHYVNNGVFFNVSSGMIFQLNERTRVAPSVGVYYHLKNSDYRGLNTTGVIASQKILFRYDKKTDLFFNTVLAENTAFFTFGLSGSLSRDNNFSRVSKTSRF